MELKSIKCRIEVNVDETFNLGSTEHSAYDLVLNVDNYTLEDYYRVLSVSVNLFNEQYSVALVGSGQSWSDNCAVLEGKILTIIQDNRVIKFDLEQRIVISTYETNLYGCAFGLYSIPDGYVIHGELEVAMYDKEFHKKWGFSGRDIFVSITNKQAFQLREDRVCLYDFEDNYYEVDYNGNLIYERSDR